MLLSWRISPGSTLAALPVIPKTVTARNPTAIAEAWPRAARNRRWPTGKHFPHWNESARRAWAESKLRFDTQWFLQPPQKQPHWRETAAKFTFPTLLISGENSRGSLISDGFAREALKTVPGMQWCRIPGAGHYLHYDAPEAFLSSVQTFLRSHYPPQKG